MYTAIASVDIHRLASSRSSSTGHSANYFSVENTALARLKLGITRKGTYYLT